MRLLDPNLLTSETGKVLVRDNAIVFSMEHARLIITADCVIIPQSGFDHSPLAQHFATLLEEHISEAAQEAQVGRAHVTSYFDGVLLKRVQHVHCGVRARWCCQS